MQARLKLWGLTAIGVAAIGCSSGGGGSDGTGTGGAGAQGTAGASGGSSGGASSAGIAGAQATAGSGGATAGATGAGGIAGAVGGAAGSGSGGGSSGSAGTGGQAGSAGGAGGRGGSGGSAGSGGSSGSGARGGTTGSGGSGTGGGSGGTNGGRGGGAGGSGAGGSGGAGGAVANPVTPTKSGNRYRFAWGDVILEVDAAAGGRVATLSLAGADLIVPVPNGTDPTTYGSVFWTSPRSSWPGTMWPPPVMIDGAMYNGGINGTHVVLDGPADTTLGVSMSKDYSADATTGWIKIAYTIHATKAQMAAPWEVSRVPRGGIVFFPLGSSVTAGPLTITQQSTTPKTVWFDDAPKTATSPDGAKLYADGSGGWEAYVLNGNLFLKRFADVPANMQPSGEGEIDVYPGAGFLEYEEQGAYKQLAASSTTNWSVEWKVVKVPSTISIAVSSNALLDFAKQQVAQ